MGWLALHLYANIMERSIQPNSFQNFVRVPLPDAVIADVTSQATDGIGEAKPVLPTRRNPRSIQRGLHRNVR